MSSLHDDAMILSDGDVVHVDGARRRARVHKLHERAAAVVRLSGTDSTIPEVKREGFGRIYPAFSLVTCQAARDKEGATAIAAIIASLPGPWRVLTRRDHHHHIIRLLIMGDLQCDQGLPTVLYSSYSDRERLESRVIGQPKVN
jgi:hypothetical protein